MQEIKSNQQGSAMIWVVVAVIVVALGVGVYVYMGKGKMDDKKAGTKTEQGGSATPVKTEVKGETKPVSSQTEVNATILPPK